MGNRNDGREEARERQREMVASLFANQAPATSLSPIAGIDVSGAEYVEEMPTRMLDPWPDNRELSADAVESLADDVEEKGVLQPILVRPRAYGRFQVIAGHHRVEAVRALAARHPGDPRWGSIRALVLELGDAQAAAAVVATNVHMIPEWTPEERGAEWIRLSKEAERMKEEDPELYRGRRVCEMVADMAKELGVKTSASSVQRDMTAANKASGRHERKPAPDGLLPAWADEYGDGAVNLPDARRLAGMKLNEQAKVHDGWVAAGPERKRYLEAVFAAGDPAKRDEMGDRLYLEAYRALSLLPVLVEGGYEWDRSAIGAAIGRAEDAAALAAMKSKGDDGDGRR